MNCSKKSIVYGALFSLLLGGAIYLRLCPPSSFLREEDVVPLKDDYEIERAIAIFPCTVDPRKKTNFTKIDRIVTYHCAQLIVTGARAVPHLIRALDRVNDFESPFVWRTQLILVLSAIGTPEALECIRMLVYQPNEEFFVHDLFSLTDFAYLHRQREVILGWIKRRVGTENSDGLPSSLTQYKLEPGMSALGWWNENSPYLYWNANVRAADSGRHERGLFMVSREAKRLGIPVDSRTGKMLSPLDGHELTSEEIEKVRRDRLQGEKDGEVR